MGDDGRIRISGPVLFSGYRRRPDLTAAATDGRWFVTSDLGSVDPDGRLTVRGRADGMIISGGENVAADEVAAVLAGCPGVREAAVVGCPDPEWGELVTAVVVAQDPARPPELAVLREAVRAVLPAAAAPRALVLVAALPLLASGKPDRLAMTALAARQMNGTGPGTVAEHTVCKNRGPARKRVARTAYSTGSGACVTRPGTIWFVERY